MNEDILERILSETYEEDLSELDDMPAWKPSLRHRIAMKRIFARYERNVRRLKEERAVQSEPAERRPLTLGRLGKRLTVFLIVIFLAALTGCTVVVFISKSFHGVVHEDNTQLFAVDVENSPAKIEYKYVLASIPDGFEMTDTDATPFDCYTLYKNKQTGQEITLIQWVKSEFDPHLNTEHYQLEETTVNGKDGFCIDFSEQTYSHSLLVWDNGDYIIEIIADLNKEELKNLSKINKL